ncbi:MAG: PLP-dependent aspartate aminotransferase family protein [Ferruginibacter sp.]
MVNGKEKSHIETLAVHAGNTEKTLINDVIQPIHLSTTFERDHNGNTQTHTYTRQSNPNRHAVELKIAALEGATTAIAFSSGLAAINALFENILAPGTHLILPDDCYHGTRKLAEQFFKRWSVIVSMVDMTDPAKIEKAISPETKLILMETPSNPQLKITDIKGVVSLAKGHNITTVCDNTFATPLLQRPLQMGVDFTMHSSTKSFSGHSDILGGVVTTNNVGELTNRIREYQQTAGAVPSPFDCWLLNRSLATLPLRFRLQCSNAMQLAIFLEQHPKIEKVYYPGLDSHPQHILAQQQMKNGFGAILSLLLKGGQEKAQHFASSLQIFKHATSLGGVESLIEHRRSVEGDHPVSPENLLRLSIGIEHIEDLKRDLKEGLEKL